MKVIVNDVPQDVEEGVRLAELLDSRGQLNAKGIAVAINGQVIPRMYWNTYCLKEGEKIIIIQATQGG